MGIAKTIFPNEPKRTLDSWKEYIRIENGGVKIENMEQISFKSAVKAIAAENETSIKEIADTCNKALPSLHQQLDRGNPTLSQMRTIFRAMGEEVVILTKSGNRFKI